MRGAQSAGAIEANARHTPSGGSGIEEDVDDLGSGEHPVQVSRGVEAKRRRRAAVQDGSVGPGSPGDRAGVSQVDAGGQSLPPPRSQVSFDHGAGPPGREQALAGEHLMMQVPSRRQRWGRASTDHPLSLPRWRDSRQ